MISWIQRYFQQHFRIVFALILASTIISFIIAFGPGSNLGQGDRRYVKHEFFGYNLASQEDTQRIDNDAKLSNQLQYGYNVLDDNGARELGERRVAALALAKEYRVPATTKDEIAAHIKTLGMFRGPDGEFDAARYSQFRDSLKLMRVSESDVSRVLGDDVQIAKVERIIAGPGYVLPSEVKRFLETADSTWTIATATVDYSTFKPSIPTDDAALTKYFQQNSGRYTIAPRVSVNAAFFPATSYTSSINLSEAEVRAYYDANPARFPNPAPKAPGAKPDAAADFAAVRPQVETAVKLERAQRFAVKAASDFSFALYEGKITPGTPAFDALLASHHLTARPLAPFTMQDGPAEFANSPAIAEEAFKLGADHLYTDAVPAPGGAVVLFYRETLPSRQPTLAEVHDKVAKDYVELEKQKRFLEFGNTLRALILNGIKAGESFDKAVASASSTTAVKVETKSLAPFTLRNPPKDLDRSVAEATMRLNKGQLSDIVPAPGHWIFVYVVDKKAPDLSPNSPAYADAQLRMAYANAGIDAGEQLNAIVQKELAKSEPVDARRK